MKDVQLKLAHNYDNPLAAAVAATVQLKSRGLTATMADAIKQKDLEFIAQAWAELDEYHGTPSPEIALIRQTLNRVSKQLLGYGLTVEVHNQVYVCVKAKARKKASSVKTLEKELARIAAMCEGRTEQEREELVRKFAEAIKVEKKVGFRKAA